MNTEVCRQTAAPDSSQKFARTVTRASFKIASLLRELSRPLEPKKARCQEVLPGPRSQQQSGLDWQVFRGDLELDLPGLERREAEVIFPERLPVDLRGFPLPGSHSGVSRVCLASLGEQVFGEEFAGVGVGESARARLRILRGPQQLLHAERQLLLFGRLAGLLVDESVHAGLLHSLPDPHPLLVVALEHQALQLFQEHRGPAEEGVEARVQQAQQRQALRAEAA